MPGLLDAVKQWHIHPAVDHFTVALLIIAVISDLFASLFATRAWLRYAAVALMILGTAAAWGSNLTGGWEAEKVWKAVKAAGGPAYDTLHLHAELGDYLPWVFLVLVLWRIGVQLFGFMAQTRGIYLIVAVLAVLAICYQGYLGGSLVYDYGVGTALFGEPRSAPAPTAEATGPATPIPTVFVPSASATPQAEASPTAGAGATSAANPSPAATATPAAEAAGTSTPAATPANAASPTASPAPSASTTVERPPKAVNL